MCVLPGSKQDLKIESRDGVEGNWSRGLGGQEGGMGGAAPRQVGVGGLRQVGGPGLRRAGQVGSAGSSPLAPPACWPLLLTTSSFFLLPLPPASSSPGTSLSLQPLFPSAASLPCPFSHPSYCSQLYWMPPPLPASVPAPPPPLSLPLFLFPIPPFPRYRLHVGTRVYFNYLFSCLNKV